MHRQFVTAVFLSMAALGAGLAHAADPAGVPSASAPAFTTADSDIGTLLDNPDTKAVLDKHVPGLAGNSQISLARAMTLRQIQSFASDMLTDDVLASIDADLAKVPGRK